MRRAHTQKRHFCFTNKWLVLVFSQKRLLPFLYWKHARVCRPTEKGFKLLFVWWSWVYLCAKLAYKFLRWLCKDWVCTLGPSFMELIDQWVVRNKTVLWEEREPDDRTFVCLLSVCLGNHDPIKGVFFMTSLVYRN